MIFAQSPARGMLALMTCTWPSLAAAELTPLPTALIANLRAALQYAKAAAEQLRLVDPGIILLRYVSDKIAPVLGPFRPPAELAATG